MNSCCLFILAQNAEEFKVSDVYLGKLFSEVEITITLNFQLTKEIEEESNIRTNAAEKFSTTNICVELIAREASCKILTVFLSYKNFTFHRNVCRIKIGKVSEKKKNYIKYGK